MRCTIRPTPPFGQLEDAHMRRRRALQAAAQQLRVSPAQLQANQPDGHPFWIVTAADMPNSACMVVDPNGKVTTYPPMSNQEIVDAHTNS